MRIAHVCPHYLPEHGGVETHVSHIAVCMVAAGHEVEVLTERRDARLDPQQVMDGVTVKRFDVPGGNRRFTLSPDLWRYMLRHGAGYDVLHAHNYHAFSSIGASLAPGARLVFTPHYHGPGHTHLGRYLHMPYRIPGTWMFARARRIICVSRSEADLVQAHFHSVAPRIRIIPNGVDVETIRHAQPLCEQTIDLLCVGRLLAYKGMERALGALGELDDRYRLIIVGEGPHRGDLESRAREAGLSGRVRFLGAVEDAILFRWYRTARVLLSLSEQEAFGMTILEALAGGASIVASDIPAHREVQVLSGADNIELVGPSDSAHDLASLIARLAQRPGSNPGSLTLPTWPWVAGQTLAIYAEGNSSI